MTRVEALAIFGLRHGATASEIKRAYRNAVKTWHPDRFQDSALRARAQEKLKLINRAYEVLKRTPLRVPTPYTPPPRPGPTAWEPPPDRFQRRSVPVVALWLAFMVLSGLARGCADVERALTLAPKPVRAVAVSQVSMKGSQWHVNRDGALASH